jgi:hypothetical protein
LYHGSSVWPDFDEILRLFRSNGPMQINIHGSFRASIILLKSLKILENHRTG